MIYEHKEAVSNQSVTHIEMLYDAFPEMVGFKLIFTGEEIYFSRVSFCNARHF